MRNRTEPWARIKRKEPGQYVAYKGKRKQASIVTAPAVFLAVVLLLTMLRIPERIGLIEKEPNQAAVPVLKLTSTYNELLAEITDMEQDADWDGDGLRNGADLYPRDIDADRNGISDGFEGKQIISGELPIEYRNVRFVASNSQSGIVFFRGDYLVSGFAGWMAFSDETETPYIFRDGNWEKAEHEWIDSICYINVPGDCRVRFCEDDPNDRDVLLDPIQAEFDNKPDERYAVANAPLLQLEQIYAAIGNGKTVQISIITEDGEQLLLIHGYDRQGNLIAAYCDSLADAGKVMVTVKAQIFWDGQKITMRSWYEFSWGELASSKGNVITVF